ncbi:FecR family protein [Belliella marina]|uniref:FecR family protein n=1 Tax=Belliella marina TaxID=1644146 RepID=A0ABW4VK70_9BACT
MDRRKQIEDFFKGSLSEEQAKDLLAWLDSVEGEEFMSAEVLQLWSEKSIEGKYKEWDSKSLWEKINKNKEDYPSPQLHRDRVIRKSILPTWLKVAASFLIIGVCTLLVFTVVNSIKTDSELVTSASKVIEKYNPPGQKTKIHLPDGSTVYLNSESRIAYSEDFLTNRQISLVGEAFFNVAKDENNPFSVTSNGITTTALGTSFNISTFNKAEKVVVTLVTGIVKLNKVGKEDALILNPGEESVLSEKDESFDKRIVDVSQKILWVDGVLRFEKTSMDEMVAVLERWYGVQIKVQGSPEKFVATGTFENNETLKNVLQVLSASIGFDYSLKEKEVLIKFK